MGTATMIRQLTGFQGDARLYKVEPPMQRTEYDYDTENDQTFDESYVVVSAAVVPYSGPETYIFAADDQGNITNWGELDGSFRGGLDHAAALRLAGYEEAA